MHNHTFAIEIRNLSKYYGKSRGVIDLNLEVEEGDFYGFIGPNGAGKSTAIRVLLGLIHPTSGEAKLLGTDARGKGVRVLRDIGYMPAEAIFYPGMYVRDILKLSAKLHGLDCTAEARKLSERLELNLSKKVDELSFGNRKKVSIVCALQHNPRLCILDEPTSGLDPLMQREFFKLLEERNRKGTTIFLSSHILSEVQRHCRNAAIISGGRILVADSLKNLRHTSVKRVCVTPAGHGFVERTLPRVSTEPMQTKAADESRNSRPMNQLEKTLRARLALKSMRDVTSDDRSLNFLYSGDVSTLVQVISTIPVVDVNISEPALDEVFMHYYESGDMGCETHTTTEQNVASDIAAPSSTDARTAFDFHSGKTDRGNMAGDVGHGGEEGANDSV